MVIDIARSPFLQRGDGMALRAIVLRANLDEDGHITKYVVHDHYLYMDGKKAYGNGDYFPCRDADAFREAYGRWLLRCKHAIEAGDQLAPSRETIATSIK